jgi:hypothetical protein
LRAHRSERLATTAAFVAGVAAQPALSHVEVKSTSPECDEYTAAFNVAVADG